MAIILKTDKTYIDRCNKAESGDYYGVVDLVKTNKSARTGLVRLDIYKDQDARANGGSPLESYEYYVSGTNFGLYFSANALAEADVYGSAYSYILNAVREPSTYTYDEEGVQSEVLGDLIWSDWESDES